MAQKRFWQVLRKLTSGFVPIRKCDTEDDHELRIVVEEEIARQLWKLENGRSKENGKS